MAEAAHSGHGAEEHGHMDIVEQKGTFDGFLVATVWGCALVAMAVALFTLAFAMNLGWFAGLGAFVVIGVGAGLIFRLSGAWWAMLIGTTVLMVIGGGIVPLIASLAS